MGRMFVTLLIINATVLASGCVDERPDTGAQQADAAPEDAIQVEHAPVAKGVQWAVPVGNSTNIVEASWQRPPPDGDTLTFTNETSQQGHEFVGLFLFSAADPPVLLNRWLGTCELGSSFDAAASTGPTFSLEVSIGESGPSGACRIRMTLYLEHLGGIELFMVAAASNGTGSLQTFFADGAPPEEQLFEASLTVAGWMDLRQGAGFKILDSSATRITEVTFRATAEADQQLLAAGLVTTKPPAAAAHLSWSWSGLPSVQGVWTGAASVEHASCEGSCDSPLAPWWSTGDPANIDLRLHEWTCVSATETARSCELMLLAVSGHGQEIHRP